MLRYVFERILVPILLMTIIPNMIVFVVHLVVNNGSDLSIISTTNPVDFICEAWMAVGVGDKETWLAVTIFSICAALSMMILGGQRYLGPRTRNGFRAEYRHNSFRYFLLGLVLAAVAFQFNLVNAYYWYKKLVPLTGTLIVFFYLVSAFLYIKGLVAPSQGEHGSSGNPIFDFYWGMELYPRLGRWLDIKLYCVSRFGMMAWLILVLITWKAQIDHRGFSFAMSASSILQLVYISRHFWWESGYCQTIDMFVDRAGWYLCYGGGGFLPIFYILNSAYQVESETNLTIVEFLFILSIGVLLNVVGLGIDNQRLNARATSGDCTVWGKPAKVINARYVDEKGKQRTNVLLASGFWGWTHHPNYVCEVLTHLVMAIPVKTASFIPYSVTIFTMCLLIHRSFRDEKKCREKYGKYWQEYCKISKYRLIPYVF